MCNFSRVWRGRGIIAPMVDLTKNQDFYRGGEGVGEKFFRKFKWIEDRFIQKYSTPSTHELINLQPSRGIFFGAPRSRSPLRRQGKSKSGKTMNKAHENEVDIMYLIFTYRVVHLITINIRSINRSETFDMVMERKFF